MSTSLRVSEDFVPVSEFKGRTAELLRRAAQSGQPLVITQNGRPAGVLLSPAAFDELAETARFVAAVRQGLDDSGAGRTHDHADVAAEARGAVRRRAR
jgi:prevent-host-death family protein